MSAHKSSIPFVIEELKRRFYTPIGQMTFWTFFLVAVIGIGALGLWVECYKAWPFWENKTDGILTAIYTYFPAIAGGSALQMLMDNRKETQQHMRSFCVLSGAVIFLLTLPFMSGVSPIWGFIWGLFGIIASLLLWWVANGVNPSFLDIDPSDSLGANPSTPPAGDAGGFNL
ncbi:hypothetical protein [Chromobacterium violaceum]|uniref:hypothetical protein n=1 Tax=Chromobacterium violaceum TaxID=536 RepID=UPI00111C36B7|nr:hypothetical protein [Chromobacterium violaceum]